MPATITPKPVALAALVAAVCVMAVLLSPGAGWAQSGTARATVAGQWDFNFRTISNRGFSGPAVGSRRTRVWNFERVCGDGGCRMIARRETTAGFKRVSIVRRGSTYVSRWRTRAPCDDRPGSFVYSERVSFTVTDSEVVVGKRLASRLRGRLVGTAAGESCQRPARATDVISGERTDLPSPPTAAFEWTPSTPTPGTSVAFTDMSEDDGSLVDWEWDFGDPASGAANTSKEPYASHTYGAPGRYRVTLTVTDDQDLKGTAVQFIDVAAP